MTRLGLVLTLICLIAWTTGCRMCASDLDYCGPTVAGGCGEACGLNASRAGSILNGTSKAVYEGQVAHEGNAFYESEVTGSAEQLGSDAFRPPVMPSQIIEGERIDGVIISVEDRKLEDAADQPSENTLLQPTLAPKKPDWPVK